jgi:hypothetical protein
LISSPGLGWLVLLKAPRRAPPLPPVFESQGSARWEAGMFAGAGPASPGATRQCPPSYIPERRPISSSKPAPRPASFWQRRICGGSSLPKLRRSSKPLPPTPRRAETSPQPTTDSSSRIHHQRRRSSAIPRSIVPLNLLALTSPFESAATTPRQVALIPISSILRPLVLNPNT